MSDPNKVGEWTTGPDEEPTLVKDLQGYDLGKVVNSWGENAFQVAKRFGDPELKEVDKNAIALGGVVLEEGPALAPSKKKS